MKQNKMTRKRAETIIASRDLILNELTKLYPDWIKLDGNLRLDASNIIKSSASELIFTAINSLKRNGSIAAQSKPSDPLFCYKLMGYRTVMAKANEKECL